MNVLSKNMAPNEMNPFHAGLIKIKMQYNETSTAPMFNRKSSTSHNIWVEFITFRRPPGFLKVNTTSVDLEKYVCVCVSLVTYQVPKYSVFQQNEDILVGVHQFNRAFAG